MPDSYPDVESGSSETELGRKPMGIFSSELLELHRKTEELLDVINLSYKPYLKQLELLELVTDLET